MERLAEKLKDILNEQDFCFEPWEIKVVEKALNRFAAYENTGLEPKEIQAIAGIASENCAKTADAIDKLLQDDAELESYRDLGPIDHLRKLVQADQEGRSVVLPCGQCKYSGPASKLSQKYGAPGVLTCHGPLCNRRNVTETDFCSRGTRMDKEDEHEAM